MPPSLEEIGARTADMYDDFGARRRCARGRISLRLASLHTCSLPASSGSSLPLCLLSWLLCAGRLKKEFRKKKK